MEVINNHKTMKHPKPDRTEEIKSKCCNAPVRTGGIGDFHDKDEVCTQYFECTACKKPCDITPQEDKPQDYTERVLAEFEKILDSIKILHTCKDFDKIWIDEEDETEKIMNSFWERILPVIKPELKAFIRKALNDQKAESYEMGRREAVAEIKSKLPKEKDVSKASEETDYEGMFRYGMYPEKAYNSCLKEISDLLNTLK
jgi:hypothetical protein